MDDFGGLRQPKRSKNQHIVSRECGAEPFTSSGGFAAFLAITILPGLLHELDRFYVASIDKYFINAGQVEFFVFVGQPGSLFHFEMAFQRF